MIELVLVFHLNHIFIGKNIFIKIHFILGYMQISKLITKLIFLLQLIKTTKIYKQNPVLKGCYIISELEDVLKSGCYESSLGYDNADWILNEIIKLKNKMAFYSKNTKKDIIMTDEEEEFYRKNDVCQFCGKKKFESDIVRDHCHLTGKYRGPAHNACNDNVTQKQSTSRPFLFHNFSNYDCHMFFKRLIV